MFVMYWNRMQGVGRSRPYFFRRCIRRVRYLGRFGQQTPTPVKATPMFAESITLNVLTDAAPIRVDGNPTRRQEPEPDRDVPYTSGTVDLFAPREDIPGNEPGRAGSELL